MSTDDVKVYVDEVLSTDYTFSSDYTITFTTPPTTDSIVLIRRETDAENKAVDFQSGAMLTEGDLDTAFDQVFNLAQETKDVAIHDFNEATDAFNAVGEYLPEINTVADDIGHGALTHIDFGDLTSTTATPRSDSVIHNVYENLANLNAVRLNKENIDTVAGINADVTTVAEGYETIQIVAKPANIEAITAVNGLSSAILNANQLVVDGSLDVLSDAANLLAVQNAATNAGTATDMAGEASQSASNAADSASTAQELKDTLDGMGIANINALISQVEDNELLTLAGL